MELKQYLNLIRKWIWLFVLVALLGGGAAYIFSSYQDPVYESTAKVLVFQPSSDQLSDLGYLSGQQLVITYSELLLMSPVLNEVSRELNIEVIPEMISVQQFRDTNILSVSVQDLDPYRAAAIADMLIIVLINQNEELQENRFSASEESLKNQIEVVQNQIANLEQEMETEAVENFQKQLASVEDQIETLEADIVNLQIQIEQLQSLDQSIETQTQLQQSRLDLQRKQGVLDLYQGLYFNFLSYETSPNSSRINTSLSSQVQSTLALYQQIYTSLLSDYEAVRLARMENSVSVISVEPAIPELEPIRPKLFINTILGIIVGLMIGFGLSFIIEFFDDTVNSETDVNRITNLPVLGYLPKISSVNMNGNSQSKVYVQENPRSPVADAFRSLRTNIEFSNIAFPIKRLIITSPDQQEGKSTTAVNLASILVQGGKQVILIDADLRRPTLHGFYKFPNRLGLSE